MMGCSLCAMTINGIYFNTIHKWTTFTKMRKSFPKINSETTSELFKKITSCWMDQYDLLLTYFSDPLIFFFCLIEFQC